MKEFEKQFNKKYPLPPTIERGPIGKDFKKGCGEMWKGALEFVQNLYKKYDLRDWDWTACQIRKDIENELSNNQTDNSTD